MVSGYATYQRGDYGQVAWLRLPQLPYLRNGIQMADWLLSGCLFLLVPTPDSAVSSLRRAEDSPAAVPLSRAEEVRGAGGPATTAGAQPGASQSWKPGRSNASQEQSPPSLPAPAEGGERCQRVRHYRGRAASGAKGSAITAGAQLAGERAAREGRGSLQSWSAAGASTPGPEPPSLGAARCEENRVARTKLGRTASPAPPVRTGRLAPELGAPGHGEGTRDGWAENSPAAKSGSAEAASSRCAPARPPAGPLACPPPPPPPSPPPLPPGRPRPPRSRFRILPVSRPARLEGASRTHSPPDGSRARPSPFPAAFEAKFGTEAAGFPARAPGSPSPPGRSPPGRPSEEPRR
ncbi:basic proline-rich protein-like [Mustela nigripes]|uniref:basic proline-rich protein-like n=1 Tax=Mustela nigripes TaxID=77151 RepID=UPI0028162352|nr:basic proline-rich protein-like [Mustela nigripes]